MIKRQRHKPNLLKAVKKEIQKARYYKSLEKMHYCEFCGCDPYEYVDIGVGYQPVAITCCDMKIGAYYGEKIAVRLSRLLEPIINDKRRIKRAHRLWNKYVVQEEASFS